MKLHLRKKGPNEPLSFMCKPLPDRWEQEFRPVIIEMIRICLKEKLEGLAANQLGLDYRVFVTNVRDDGPRVFINPEIDITDYDEELVVEHCGSFPKKDTERWRAKGLLVTGINLKNELFRLDTGTDMTIRNEEIGERLAARIQHEMEHINGVNVRVEPDLDAFVQKALDETLGA